MIYLIYLIVMYKYFHQSIINYFKLYYQVIKIKHDEISYFKVFTNPLFQILQVLLFILISLLI